MALAALSLPAGTPFLSTRAATAAHVNGVSTDVFMRVQAANPALIPAPPRYIQVCRARSSLPCQQALPRTLPKAAASRSRNQASVLGVSLVKERSRLRRADHLSLSLHSQKQPLQGLAENVLCSSLTGRKGLGAVALSSGLESPAAWESFGAYDSLSYRSVQNGGGSLVVASGDYGGWDRVAGFLGWVFGALLAFVLAIASFAFVPSGSVGIRTTFGQVETQALRPGLHFNYPVISNIQNLTTKTQLIVADESDVPTKEGLVVELDVSILHSRDPTKAADLYVTVGPDYVNRVILPELHSAVANITSEYNAKALYTDARAQLTQELTSYLQHKLGHKGIIIEDVLLRAIKLPEQLTQAIQDKLQTEQEAQRMEFVLLKEQQEAERKRIEASGIATFQKIVSEGISPQLLQWKGIEATQELAKSPNSKVVVIGNAKDGLPIILGGDDNIMYKRKK